MFFSRRYPKWFVWSWRATAFLLYVAVFASVAAFAEEEEAPWLLRWMSKGQVGLRDSLQQQAKKRKKPLSERVSETLRFAFSASAVLFRSSKVPLPRRCCLRVDRSGCHGPRKGRFFKAPPRSGWRSRVGCVDSTVRGSSALFRRQQQRFLSFFAQARQRGQRVRAASSSLRFIGYRVSAKRKPTVSEAPPAEASGDASSCGVLCAFPSISLPSAYEGTCGNNVPLLSSCASGSCLEKKETCVGPPSGENPQILRWMTAPAIRSFQSSSSQSPEASTRTPPPALSRSGSLTNGPKI